VNEETLAHWGLERQKQKQYANGCMKECEIINSSEYLRLALV
jgi:hypothetical protein